MIDTTRTEGMRGCNAHGMLAEEKLRAQPFIVDVGMEVGPIAADSIEYAVSHTDIAADTLAVVESKSTDLVETFADRIAERVLARGVLRTAAAVHKPGTPVGVPFSDISVAVRRNGPLVDNGTIRRTVLALGPNLGNGRAHLDAAVEALGALDLHLTAVPDYLSTDPLLAPGQESQPRYTSAVTAVIAAMSPLVLLTELRRIRVRDGRVCEQRQGPRTIDLDIADAEGVASINPRLTLPHPRAGERLFVLEPWAQIRSEATLGSVSITSLIEGLRRWRPDRRDDPLLRRDSERRRSMSLTSIRNLAFSLAFGLGYGLVFCAFALSGGHAPQPVPLPLGTLILSFSVFLFTWGCRVKAMWEKDQPEKKDRRRTRRRISPLQTAHVTVPVQVCSRCRAWLADFFGLCTMLLWRTGETLCVREQVLAAMLTAISSAVLT